MKVSSIKQIYNITEVTKTTRTAGETRESTQRFQVAPAQDIFTIASGFRTIKVSNPDMLQ